MNKIFLRSLIMAAILSLFVGVSLTQSEPPPPDQPDGGAPVDEVYDYLPVIRKPPLNTIFGIDMGEVIESNGFELFSTNGTTWIRRGNLLWSEVEPTEGTRNWSALAGLEQEMINASQQEMKLILVVTSTPAWARLLPSYSCGPIRSDKFSAFANFMHDLVERYSRPPYNVVFWEIWNEPDASPNPASEAFLFGCWGNDTDPYYGGRYYGDMLEVVAPQIRAANPNAKIVFGGLLLNCNPTLDSNCISGNFFEGALRSGAGPHFDAVSFHAVDLFYAPTGGLGVYAQTSWNSTYNTTGPVGQAKAQFIKSVLAAFGYPNKMLLNTETGLICLPEGHALCDTGPSSDYELTKAYYVAMVYASAIAEGLDANIWYNVFGWRNSGLLEPDLDPRPAYDAYIFAREEMKNASFGTRLTTYSGVLGYELDRGDKVIWVLWSTDQNNHTINLAETPAAVFDVFGEEDLSPSSTLTVSPKPVYLEWPD